MPKEVDKNQENIAPEREESISGKGKWFTMSKAAKRSNKVSFKALRYFKNKVIDVLGNTELRDNE